MKRKKISVEKIISDAKGKGLVKIIPEENSDYYLLNLPLRKYFAREGIVYYFEGNGIENEKDWWIDLTKIEIIYPKI